MPARPVVLLRHVAAPPTDGECLTRYAQSRDEAAFAELVRRNGPLVLRACRSVLRDPAAAEDAFQTTFLTLARNANRLLGSPSVAGWRFAVVPRAREKASKELAALGEAAAGPLRAAEAKATSAELRQRLAPVVAALVEAKPTGERLRAIRAVEALERVGTPEGRKLLAMLAAGAVGATLTEDAKAALGRLGQ